MRVVLIAVDSVSGLIYPPVVAQNEERADGWGGLLEARPSHGAGPAEAARYLLGWGQRALAYLRNALAWVEPQRCVWHLAEPERRSGAGGESGGAGRVQSGG